MKKLLLIFILILSVLSCKTPEEKIVDSFNENRSSRRRSRTLEIKGAEIYDTLYYHDLAKMYAQNENDKPYFEKKLREMNHYRDSVIALKLDKPQRDSLMHIGFEQRERYDRKITHLGHQENYMYLLLRTTPKDSIYAYYAYIVTNRDTLKFIVDHKFNIICPVFMYED